MKRIIAAVLASMLLVMCGCQKQNLSTAAVAADPTAKTAASSSSVNSSAQKKVNAEDTASRFVSEYDDVDPNRMVDVSWFDDCVIIGDSLTLGLSMYNDRTFELGDAMFVCAGSLGYTNALMPLDAEGNVHPYYNNEQTLVDDAAEITGANKAIITLGINDIALYGVEGTLDSAEELLSRIRAKSPNLVIYLETVTPMIKSAQSGNFNNDVIRELNKELAVFAKEHRCKFLDSYTAFADSEGNLPVYYCGDVEAQGIHFNNDSYRIWKNYIMCNVDPKDGGGKRRVTSEIEKLEEQTESTEEVSEEESDIEEEEEESTQEQQNYENESWYNDPYWDQFEDDDDSSITESDDEDEDDDEYYSEDDIYYEDDEEYYDDYE